MQDTKGTGVPKKELAKPSRAKTMRRVCAASGVGACAHLLAAGAQFSGESGESENTQASIWGSESVISEGKRLPTYLYTHSEGVKTILICG